MTIEIVRRIAYLSAGCLAVAFLIWVYVAARATSLDEIRGWQLAANMALTVGAFVGAIGAIASTYVS